MDEVNLEADRMIGTPARKISAGTKSSTAVKPDHCELPLDAQESHKRVAFSDSPIGKLPSELRDKIYRKILRIEPVEDLEDFSSNDDMTVSLPSRSKPPETSRLAILPVCRQVYHEACYLYHSINHLEFRTAASVVKFKDELPTARSRALTCVDLTSNGFVSYPDNCPDTMYLQEALKFLAECSNLRDLTIKVSHEFSHHLSILLKLEKVEKLDIRLLNRDLFFSQRLKKTRTRVIELRRKILRLGADESGSNDARNENHHFGSGNNGVIVEFQHC